MRYIILVALLATAAHALPDPLCVQGRSMEPTLHHGHCYAVRDTTGLQRGDVVWLPDLGHDGLVKRLTLTEGDAMLNGNPVPAGRVWITADGGGTDSRKLGHVARHLIRGIVVVPPDSTEETQ